MKYATTTPWHEKIPLFRPMLSIWREEIEAYCESMDLSPVSDQSNLDVTFYRNRIRHELIPILEQYNPGITTALWKMSNTLQADREILNSFIDDYYQNVASKTNEEGVIKFKRARFLTLHLGIQRRIVRLGIHRIRPDIRDIGYDEVDKVIRYISNPPTSRELDLFRGMRLRVENEIFMIFPTDKNVLENEVPQLSDGEPQQLDIPGSIELSGGWEIRTEKNYVTKSLSVEALDNQDQLIAYIDLEKITKPLLVRTRSPGDVFRPLGMEGKRIKVSDFLINEKMPRWQRDHWPLIYSGGELIWIPGYRIADQVKITLKTSEMVKLTLKKL
jgi:tRNA(Ile)-lysidine synthase